MSAQLTLFGPGPPDRVGSVPKPGVDDERTGRESPEEIPEKKPAAPKAKAAKPAARVPEASPAESEAAKPPAAGEDAPLAARVKPAAPGPEASPEAPPEDSGARTRPAGGDGAPLTAPATDSVSGAPARGSPAPGRTAAGTAAAPSIEAPAETDSPPAPEASIAGPESDTASASGDRGGVGEALPPAEETSPAAVPKGAAPREEAQPATGSGYQVLALRYRPQTFSELVGQEAVARTIRNAIRKDRIWNAFLFSGPRGVGKTTTARILAKALNCHAASGPTPDPCGTCVSCREITGGYSRDVPEIDGASHNSVEKAREIIETAAYRPSRDRFRIFLVDEVHMLSKGAFNALLKTLEEPPSHVKFLFATTEIHRIPETILSRCQEFDLRTLNRSQLSGLLGRIVEKEGFRVQPEALAQIVRFGRGSVRDALSALDQVLAAADREVTADTVSEILGVPGVAICRRAAEAIVAGDRGVVFEVVEELVSTGRDLRHFLTLLMQYLRDLVVVRVAADRPGLLEWPDEREALTALSGKFSEEDLLRSLDLLAGAEEQLRWAAEPRFHLEMALLKLVELPRLAAFDALLERLEEPEAVPSPSRASRAARSSSGQSASLPAPAPVAADRPPPARPAKAQGETSGGEIAEIPEVVRDYQETFGGRIIARRPLSETPAGGDGPSGSP